MIGIADRGNLNDEKYVTERSELLHIGNKGRILELIWIQYLFWDLDHQTTGE